MIDTPIRHMLFLAGLLFVILSSGRLQCALNCYDRASQYSSDPALVADCHPLARAELTQSPVASFCHNGHSSSGIDREPVLQRIDGGQFLAIFTPRCETPDYRSAEPLSQTFAVLIHPIQPNSEVLPPSQNHKQLRSTILLM